MGIRINKCLGYGLTDLTGHDDRRFTESIYDISERAFDLTLEDFFKYCQVNNGLSNYFNLTFAEMIFMSKGHDERLKTSNLNNWIIYDDECEANTVVFIPPGHDDWHRHDDIIDYVESSYLSKEGPQNEVIDLTVGIYPFNSLYMDSRNGCRVTTIPVYLDFIRATEKLPDDKPLPDDWLNGIPPHYFPFKTIGEIRKYYRPIVPIDITLFCRFMNVFRDDNTLKYLRPLMYTYWA